MIIKIIGLKYILTLIIAVLGAAGLWAQPGSWTVVPVGGQAIDQLQDTPEKVYFLSGGSLFSYDKETTESQYYIPGGTVSDSGIKFMKYNGEGKYLLLAYENGNIDLVYDSGKIVNMPEIKDANLTMAKAINSVNFGDGHIYVATTFGIVVYDDAKHHVVESGIYNENIPAVFALGKRLIIFRKDASGTYRLCYAPLDERHNTVDKFTMVQRDAGYNNVVVISDDTYMTGANGSVQSYKLEPDKSWLIGFTSIISGAGGKSVLTACKDGSYIAGADGIYQLTPEGKTSGKVAYPKEFGNKLVSLWSNPNEIWAAGPDGVAGYKLSNGSATLTVAEYFPQALRQPRIWYAEPSPDGTKVYLSECSRTDIFPNVSSDNSFFSVPLMHETYDWATGEIESMAVQAPDGKIAMGGSSRVLFDPVDPSIRYVGSLFYGLNVIKDGECVARYDDTNSPLASRWGSQIYDLAFDNNGNLWMIMWMINSDAVAGSDPHPVKMLPKESLDKIRQGQYENLKWEQPKWVDGYLGKLDGKIIFSSKSNKGLSVNGGWGSPLVGFDTKGTTAVSDDTYQKYGNFRDQDGGVNNTTRKSWMVEDHDGHIWIGTDQGVFVVRDINQIADGSSNYLDVIRPKVPRNDGTIYADYLLSADMIMCITVDSNNRKWIATTTSGLYCVSPDGTEILANHNMDNSPLMSNVTTFVACDPNSNKVLVGSPEGVYMLESDSSPARDDYSEIYAYPNPVKPDYTGPITIDGLMEGSLVKITDAHGHVVWSGRAEGGMAVWDGCDATGRRVRTGVYIAMASQNTSGSSGAMTKIMVIN